MECIRTMACDGDCQDKCFVETASIEISGMAALCNLHWTAHWQKICSVYTVLASAEGPAVRMKILSDQNQKIMLKTVKKQDPIINLTYHVTQHGRWTSVSRMYTVMETVIVRINVL